MKKLALVFGLFTFGSITAQDFHFSQTLQTPTLINPAATGVFDGYERVIINQRNQWLGAKTQFMTTNISADANLLKTRSHQNAHLGLGLSLYNDIGGDAKFGSQSATLNMSGILPAGNGHIFSGGLQLGYANRKADLSRLTWASQWNGTSYDPTLSSQENVTYSTFSYADLGAGFLYTYDGGENTFSRDNDMKLQLGVSVQHANQPTMRYVGGIGDKLYRKYVFHGSFLKEIAYSKWAYDIKFLQLLQGPHMETMLGFHMKYRFAEGTKITGMMQESSVAFGMNFRVKDAIIPTVAVQYKSFRFGMSYDITISKLRHTNTGSLEFSLSYTNFHHALFKRRGY
jgi:type IX secretion system PorP/SprF family membrane protein